MGFHFCNKQYFLTFTSNHFYDREVHFVTVMFMFGSNTSSISLSPVRASDSNATVLSYCLLSLSKPVLYSFLVSDSVYDVIYYIICQSCKEIVTVTEGI
jgi:hypothetical protein